MRIEVETRDVAVLRTMTGPLCDAVTGREDSAMLLRELARSNLFVVSLDEQGEWYRYHRLFSELLLYELRSSRPDLVPTLRRRGHPEEAESLACEASSLVDRFRLQRIPQATLVPIALGRALAGRGKLEEAQVELESAYFARRRLPGLSPCPTLVGLLALASVRATRGDRAGARAVLAEARAILEDNPDAGIFPELLERQKRRLRAQATGRTARRRAHRTRARRRAIHPADGREPLRGAKHRKDPDQIHLPQAGRLLAGRSRGGGSRQGTPLVARGPINPPGETQRWVMTHQPILHYARRPKEIRRAAVNG